MAILLNSQKISEYCNETQTIKQDFFETSSLKEEDTNNLLQDMSALKNEISIFNEEKKELSKATEKMFKEMSSLNANISDISFLITILSLKDKTFSQHLNDTKNENKLMIEANKGRDGEILALKESISEILPMIKEASIQLTETNKENRELKKENIRLFEEITTIKDYIAKINQKVDIANTCKENMENNTKIKSVDHRVDNSKDKILEVVANGTKEIKEANKRIEKEMNSQDMVTENNKLINETKILNSVPTILKDGILWKVSF